MSTGSRRTCAICGLRERHIKVKMHFSKFPRNELRCKEWVRAVGKEDLVYLPIEKLSELKHVCENHFHKQDFKRKTHRLKKNAVPKLNLSLPPLTDEQLKDFPLPMFQRKEGEDMLHIFPNPVKEADRFRTWLYAVGRDILNLDNKKIHKNHRVCHKHFETRYSTWTRRLTGNAVPTLHLRDPPKEDYTLEKTDADLLLAARGGLISQEEEYLEAEAEDEQKETENEQKETKDEQKETEGPFSWQRPSAVVPCDADGIQEDVDTITLWDDHDDGYTKAGASKNVRTSEDVVTSENVLTSTDVQTVPALYQCNSCEQNIQGFRYVCLVCCDYDLCADCESKGRHLEHYMLRVPPGKPKDEVQEVLRTVRQAINNGIIHLSAGNEVEIKQEVEDVADDPIALAEYPDSPDTYCPDEDDENEKSSTPENPEDCDSEGWDIETLEEESDLEVIETTPPKAASEENSQKKAALQEKLKPFICTTPGNVEENTQKKAAVQEKPKPFICTTPGKIEGKTQKKAAVQEKPFRCSTPVTLKFEPTENGQFIVTPQRPFVVTPEKTKSPQVLVTSERTKDRQVVVTSERTKDRPVVVACTKDSLVTPESTKDRRVVVTPARTKDRRVVVTPESTKDRRVVVTPARTKDSLVTSERTKDRHLVVTPARTKDGQFVIAPEGIKDRQFIITSEKTNDGQFFITPEIPKDRQLVVSPERTKYSQSIVTPEKTIYSQSIDTPERTKYSHSIVTPEKTIYSQSIVTQERMKDTSMTPVTLNFSLKDNSFVVKQQRTKDITEQDHKENRSTKQTPIKLRKIEAPGNISTTDSKKLVPIILKTHGGNIVKRVTELSSGKIGIDPKTNISKKVMPQPILKTTSDGKIVTISTSNPSVIYSLVKPSDGKSVTVPVNVTSRRETVPQSHVQIGEKIVLRLPSTSSRAGKLVTMPMAKTSDGKLVTMQTSSGKTVMMPMAKTSDGKLVTMQTSSGKTVTLPMEKNNDSKTSDGKLVTVQTSAGKTVTLPMDKNNDSKIVTMPSAKSGTIMYIPAFPDNSSENPVIISKVNHGGAKLRTYPVKRRISVASTLVTSAKVPSPALKRRMSTISTKEYEQKLMEPIIKKRAVVCLERLTKEEIDAYLHRS